MKWDEDLFHETRGSAAVLSPAAGTPPPLKQFERDGRLEQPILRRKDYLTDTWCHLNLARATRPFVAPQLAKTEEARCYFCPGSKAFTPRDVKTQTDTVTVGDSSWRLRAFPNLYPWLAEHGNVVESPRHKVSLSDIDEEDQAAALLTIRRLCERFEADGLHPMVFKNQGWGASTPHTHWQYGALPYIPKRELCELETAQRFKQKWGRNVFDSIVEAERERKERFVCEDRSVACITPFAPRSNYEAWLILKSSLSSLTSAGNTELRDLATMLTRLLRVLFTELNIDSLIVVCHQLRGEDSYRLHLEALPYKHWAGAERGFEEYAVEVMPEQAAAFLRKRIG